MNKETDEPDADGLEFKWFGFISVNEFRIS